MSLLLALSIFMWVIFESLTDGRARQRKSAVRIFQEFQAIQIAENQAQRQFLGLSCENSVQQNGIQFSIQCSYHQVNIRYPQGEFLLKTE